MKILKVFGQKTAKSGLWVVFCCYGLLTSCHGHSAVYLCSSASDNYHEISILSHSNVGRLEIDAPVFGLPNRAGIALEVFYRVSDLKSLRFYYALPVSMALEHAKSLSLDYFLLFGKKPTTSSDYIDGGSYVVFELRMDDDGAYAFENSSANHSAQLGDFVSVVISYTVEEDDSAIEDLESGVHSFPLSLDPLDASGTVQLKLDKEKIIFSNEHDVEIEVAIKGMKNSYTLKCKFDLMGGG